ncbi:MAG: adenine phosphoribosyltransferase [Nitrososphaerota archaeon]|nr:adenine phosphoribosyltransferase [Nitrososphaerota archaeon]MDG7038937.1 adenine phosphoribosyltransferase [Nitrososphaerota archaeon]MDG7041037.1 adenine phosphoribosyltransferase [Nitrososphaerota archaeon]MDG7041651.1 adenine phosphoribosyltransferase [Nitrososphaerota archaeon]MDG7042854.1 adenine phosphoribosyltransferase [Nitrososphaerota archaeon]
MVKYTLTRCSTLIQVSDLKRYIRDIPDYPVKGVIFRDLTPMFKDPLIFSAVIDDLYMKLREFKLDKVAGVEARGFIVGSPLAIKLGIGFIPLRKAGKLPWSKKKITYDLEYGQESLEVHTDAIKRGERIAIVDDLLATGGTAAAAAKLLESIGGRTEVIAFVVSLNYLKGKEKLSKYRVITLVDYD